MKVERSNIKMYFTDEMLSDCVIKVTDDNGCFIEAETRGAKLDADITEPPRNGVTR